MRACMWFTSAVGSSESASSLATGLAAAALFLSLASAPTTAYPVIFFSILTAMTRFLVFVFAGLGAGGHVAGGAGEERGPHPNPSPALRERGSSWLLLFCGLARGLPGRGFFRGLARGGLFGCLARCRLLRGLLHRRLLRSLPVRGLLRRLLRAGLLRRGLLHGLARGSLLLGLLFRLFLACGLFFEIGISPALLHSLIRL